LRYLNMLPIAAKPLPYFLSFLLLMAAGNSFSQELYPIKLSNISWHDKQPELRYKPNGNDFVITNGNRLFTRALYGTNTAFRVEAGDRPEFALYMPGMGGNFKLGIGTNDKSKWLTQANKITARYRAGAMIYVIEDSLLGRGKLHIEMLALADAEGFILKTKFENVDNPVELYCAFGGATGRRFSRDGDMGPDPESNFYLKAENCKGNEYTIDKSNFSLVYGAAKDKRLSGTFPLTATLKIADATRLSSPVELHQSTVDTAPAIVGKIAVSTGQENYFSIYNPSTKNNVSYNQLSSVFEQAEAARQQLASRIVVNTPDSFINTIGGALSIAADAIWEAPSYMHGAVGWRMRLPGWRGAYAADALGWHDRAKTHLSAYSLSQLTDPAVGPIVPDTAMHLARSTEKLGIGMFTSGYISRDPNGANLRAHHYDMNLVYIDQLFRHFAWTGDTAFMRKMWPVIKRHLDWEIRNFDADGNGLFDAYAAIWASDALQYSGGDVTHTSAYNYFHFKKAAQVAAIIGEDGEPYRRQADTIAYAMNRLLWMPGEGTYAEFKDALGNKLLHPSAAIWSVYHTIDSEVPHTLDAYQMLRYVDNEIPHIPIRAKGLDNGNYYTVSTTNWMPYMWSLNNVVLAESMHLALANWQAGRTDEAFRLFKSEVLQSMYLGGSPGNIVQILSHDAVRGEAYRDFADPVGMFSRALVEGLFGIVPDALSNSLLIRPGLPSSWNNASFSTPDISFDFKRTGRTDIYSLEQRLAMTLDLRFHAIAQGEVHSIVVNNKITDWTNVIDAVGKPVIEIKAAAASKYIIKIVWKDRKPVLPPKEKIYVRGDTLVATFPGALKMKTIDPQNALGQVTSLQTGFSATIDAVNGNYTVFVQLKQGRLTWWMPVCFKVVDAIELVSVKDAEENSNTFRLQNNTRQNTTANVRINNFKTSIYLSGGRSGSAITIPESELIAGTNTVTIDYGGGKTISTQLINWNGKKQMKQQVVDMRSHFNDKVTNIFRNKYLSPRPAATTLQLPWQGIGDWPHPHETFDVNDSGLRKSAGDKNEVILPQGIRFSTPGVADAHNIMFTSQWDNYPREKTIPLSGRASHAWLLMAGSTNPMQSQLTNAVIIVQYTNGSMDSLVLRNPETWWPIDQDYYTDGFAFSLKKPRPLRVHLASGKIFSGDESKAKFNGKKIPGGVATVFDMVLNENKTLQSLTVRAVANDVVVGLMAVTLGL
jgi:hypothetical protein